MTSLKDNLKNLPCISILQKLSRDKRKVYLVGGFLRDFFLSYRNFNNNHSGIKPALSAKERGIPTALCHSGQRAGPDRLIPIRPRPFDKRGGPKEDSARTPYKSLWDSTGRAPYKSLWDSTGRGESRVPIWERAKQRYDLDFGVDRHAISLARNFAKKIKAGFVVLDRLHGCARVVKKIDSQSYTYDFTDLRGKDIKSDLLKRDFTINSLALDLKDIDKISKLEDAIIDPASGIKDLKNRVIRVTSKDSFKQDPLRIMRAFSLSAQLKFKIDSQTFSLIKREKKNLIDSAFERIRDELFKILDTSDSHLILKNLDDLRILELILPEIKVMQGIEQGPYHHLDVWRHSKEALRQIEQFLIENQKDEDLSNYLNETLAAGRKRHQLLKLGALLHDIGKPEAMHIEGKKISFHGHERLGLMFVKSISERLKLSNIEEASLRLMILWHLRPGYLSDIKILSPRAKFRFFRDAKNESVSVLLISLADQRATRGPLTEGKSRRHHEDMIHSLIGEFFRLKKEKPLKPILTGKDLIKKLKLKPSPIFGKILKKIEELQATGKINSKEEALRQVKKILKR